MSEENPSAADGCDSTIVEIRIKGYLHNKWAERMEGLTIRREEDGTTLIAGPLPDQTALHSILQVIRDMNLHLISLREVATDGEG